MTDTPPSLGTPFATKSLVQDRIGLITISLYPVINQTMLPHKRAHVFHINKMALPAQSIDLRLQLNALGNQLNLSGTVNGTINDWFQYFYNSWFNFSKLTILSFHNLKGDIIQDTKDQANPAILLPIVHSAIITCRKANVKFVRVQLTVNFASFVNINPRGPTILCMEYYIKLPQMLVQVMNRQGTAYNLLTFHGSSNLCIFLADDFQTQILDFTFQDGPVDLQPLRFNLSTAQIDSTKLRSDIKAKILRLAFAMVCNTLFLKLCLGYSNQLHMAIDHICRVYNDRNGNQVISTVQAYFQQLMNAVCSFSSQCDFPVSICAKF
jgi:hypothetical protein